MRGATLRQLRAFSLVARHQSFGRAAAELHLTPSAVSLQIKELEQSVGLALFGRNGRASILTPAGEILLTDVNRALRALKDADDAVNRLRGQETGVVSIGMVSNAKYFIPRLLGRFHLVHPGVEIRVVVGNRERLLRHLANGEVDFAVMGQPPRELETRSEPLGPQPLGIIASPDHRLAVERDITAESLVTQEFIVREAGSGTRAAMDRFFHDMHISPTRVIELDSNESIKQAVMGNMGLAFISLHTVSLELQTGMLVMLDVVGLPLVRCWHVVSLESETMSDAAQSMRRFIIDFGGGFIEREFVGLERRHPLERPAAGSAAAVNG
jgi:DNA-binding transcriptional LysR family regulator